MNFATWAIILAPICAAVAGGFVAKYLRPNATQLELMEEMRKERETDAARITRLEKNDRVLQDYVHQLRQHIADEKPPPPPPWPSTLS